MDLENFVTWTLVVIIVFISVAAILIWLRSSSRLKEPLTLALALLVLLSASFLVEIHATDTWVMMMVNGVGVVPRAFMPLAVLYMAFMAVDKERTGRSVVLVLGIVMGLLVIAEWTNGMHHLFYSDVIVKSIGVTEATVEGVLGQPAYLDFEPGPLYRVFIGGVILSVSMAIGVLAWGSIRASEVRRGQLMTLTMAVSMTIVPLIISQASGQVNVVLCVIVGSTLGFMVIMLGFFQFEISDITPWILRQVAESSCEGHIVMDKNDVVVQHNRIASELSGITLMGRDLDDIASDLGIGGGPPGSGSDGRVTIEGREVSFSTSDIRNGRGRVIGSMLTLVDITDITDIERELRQSNAKLELLSRITRHDIMNQNMAIQGYASLVKDMFRSNEEASAFLDRIARSSRAIDMQLEFARDYQNLGSGEPGWQDLDTVFRRAFEESHLPGIELDLDIGGVRVMADLMLPRVIYNLFDNCKRHGKRVTGIHVGNRVIGDTLRVYFEDDGVGVQLCDKARIFDIGEGDNTGVGLFAAREILAITGISIWEAGEPGEGARFVMSIPEGGWSIDPPAQ